MHAFIFGKLPVSLLLSQWQTMVLTSVFFIPRIYLFELCMLRSHKNLVGFKEKKKKNRNKLINKQTPRQQPNMFIATNINAFSNNPLFFPILFSLSWILSELLSVLNSWLQVLCLLQRVKDVRRNQGESLLGPSPVQV